MKYYYFFKNDKKNGPHTIEELGSLRLEKSTMVWTEGQSQWTKAENIPELSDILINEPPPLPNKEESKIIDKLVKSIQPQQKRNPKYDYTYKREISATLIGVGWMIFIFILRISGVITFDSYENQIIFNSIFLVISIIPRIFVRLWVIKIAKRQNRNFASWGVLGFFFPAIILIIIGQRT
jgi:hypothetical protein